MKAELMSMWMNHEKYFFQDGYISVLWLFFLPTKQLQNMKRGSSISCRDWHEGHAAAEIKNTSGN